MKENDEGWVYVPPQEDCFTVILGKTPQSSSLGLRWHRVEQVH